MGKGTTKRRMPTATDVTKHKVTMVKRLAAMEKAARKADRNDTNKDRVAIKTAFRKVEPKIWFSGCPEGHLHLKELRNAGDYPVVLYQISKTSGSWTLSDDGMLVGSLLGAWSERHESDFYMPNPNYAEEARRLRLEESAWKKANLETKSTPFAFVMGANRYVLRDQKRQMPNTLSELQAYLPASAPNVDLLLRNIAASFNMTVRREWWQPSSTDGELAMHFTVKQAEDALRSYLACEKLVVKLFEEVMLLDAAVRK